MARQSELTLDKYNQLKRQVEQLQREHDRAAGALEQIRLRLVTEFGCNSIKQAERLLVKLEQEAGELEKRFDKELKDFQKELAKHEGEETT